MTVTAPSYRSDDVVALVPGMGYPRLGQIVRHPALGMTDLKTKQGDPRKFTAEDVAALRLIRLVSVENDIPRRAKAGWPEWIAEAVSLIRHTLVADLAGQVLIIRGNQVQVHPLHWLPEILRGAKDLVTLIPCEQLIDGLV